MEKCLLDTKTRLKRLIEALKSIILAPTEHIKQLQVEIYEITLDINFKNANSMGEIMQAASDFMKRNYKIEVFT